ncbi:ribonuclease HII [Candidatus Uhrbacteria bacterium]|nr:ribonuclease HII [Candidatus Uhrbacteria bacterium]
MRFSPGIGIDEVGRGAWAGPFVACALQVTREEFRVKGVRDSKLLSPRQREELSGTLRKMHQHGIGIVSVEELDLFGMTKAQAMVFERAIAALTVSSSWPRPTAKTGPARSDRSPDSGPPPRRGRQARMTVMIDGLPIKTHPEWFSVIDGDQKIYSIAAASIIAKVARDQMMLELHEQESRYRFDLHKGYGTQLHQQKLEEYGPSVHHRRLFEPIRKLYTSE